MQRFPLPLHVPHLIQNVVGFQHEAELPRNKVAQNAAPAFAQLDRYGSLEVAGAAVSVSLKRYRFLESTQQLIPATRPVPKTLSRTIRQTGAFFLSPKISNNNNILS